jgi:transcription antitermination factor NusG
VARKRKSIKGWHVVCTHQFREFEARREMSKAGFEVEMPMMRLPRNRDGVRRVVPLFEGYAFVRETEGWWQLRGISGVSHVLLSCEKPAVLADEALQFFLTVSVDEHGYYEDPVMRLFKVGEAVSPASGRFAGIKGKLMALDSSGRAEILFSMLGREVRTQEYRVQELA